MVSDKFFRLQNLKFSKASAFAGAFSLVLILFSVMNFSSRFSQNEDRFVPPPPALHHFAFGYSQPIADSLWIRAIQDFDFCESKIDENLCKGRSWLYEMLDTITNLSPPFYMPFLVGPLALTVLISDIEGASRLFDKAVLAFPNDWKILFRAAYQALYEEKNDSKAAELMFRAAKNGAPEWAFALATRLYTRSGHEEMAFRMFKDLEEQGFEDYVLKRMKQHLEKVKK